MDGWINEVVVWSETYACVVYGKVKQLSVSPLQAWVAVEKEGLVICSHCNCMAGLGEACSHVAALLFVVGC